MTILPPIVPSFLKVVAVSPVAAGAVAAGTVAVILWKKRKKQQNRT